MTARTILDWTPAGHPRGHFPAEELAQQFRNQGIPATVVAETGDGRFLVVVPDQGGES